MRSNTELRNLAWKRLWADRWFGRLFGGGLLLSLCGYAVNVVVGGILGRLHVQSWMEYAQTVAQNRQDLTTPVPQLTPDFISQATSSTVLTVFLSYIMAGIAAYGTAVILLRCLKNEEEGWLGAAFGGFAMPFGLLWLMVRYILVFVGWAIVALGVPGLIAGLAYPFVKTLSVGMISVCAGIGVAAGLSWAIFIFCIPFYRYRFLFLVKAEHPDWSAGECMKSCRELMKGNMLKSFRLDCSYWKPITLVLLPTLGFFMASSFLALEFRANGMVVAVAFVIALLALFPAFAGGVVLAQYIGVGQGFLYQDLKDGQTTEQNERN